MKEEAGRGENEREGKHEVTRNTRDVRRMRTKNEDAGGTEEEEEEVNQLAEKQPEAQW